MEVIIGAPGTGLGVTFGSRPEGLSVFVSVVLGEESLQVTDGMVVVTVKLIAGNLHALLEVGCLL